MGFEKIIYNIAVGVPGFLLGIVIHEWAHALVSYKFGDNTAKMSGRLTLNPAPHLDIIGTVIFPLIGAISGWAMFGWAKPVPVDPRRYKNFRWGMFCVSFAGPLSNIVVAVIAAFLISFVSLKVPATFYFYGPFLEIFRNAVIVNIILAVFNLIPFPPLDGSRMVSSFLSYENMRKFDELQRFSLIFLLVLWFTPLLQILLMPAIRFGDGLIFFFLKLLA